MWTFKSCLRDSTVAKLNGIEEEVKGEGDFNQIAVLEISLSRSSFSAAAPILCTAPPEQGKEGKAPNDCFFWGSSSAKSRLSSLLKEGRGERERLSSRHNESREREREREKEGREREQKSICVVRATLSAPLICLRICQDPGRRREREE